MDIFGMGTGEIILVIIVAIMIFGPNKIPEIARTVGKAINTIKQTSSDLTSQITKEIDEVEQSTREHAPPSAATSTSAAPPPVTITPPQIPPGPPQAGSTPPTSETTGED